MENNLPKKSEKKLLFIIMLLLIILILLFGYYLFFYEPRIDKNLNSNSEIVDKEDSEPKVIDLDVDSTLVQTLSNRVIGVFTNDFGSKYEDYFYKKDKTILSEEDQSFKLALVTKSFKLYENNFDSSIDEETLKKAYYDLFGKNADYSRTSFSINECGGNYEWSDKTNRYEAGEPDGCGGISCGGTNSKLAYAKQIVSDDVEKIELYEYFYYADARDACLNGSSGVVNVYSDYACTNLIDTCSGDTCNSGQDVFKKYAEKLGLYKYTFIKDSDGIYVFTSVEKVK